MNPEVTVRSRGVMEKCTFCVQRISDARAEATKDGRELKGSDVRTACQEACSTNAIHFGDINNKEEEFHTYRNHELGYFLLEELNIRPNVTYIAKLKNTRFGESIVSTDYSVEAPVVAGRLSIAQIEELVAKPMDTKPDKKFFIALTISGSALLIGAICLLYTFLLWNWYVGK